LQVGEIGDSVVSNAGQSDLPKQKEIVIATNPKATSKGGDNKPKAQVPTIQIKAVGGYKILGTEVIDGKEVKTYGAKVWEGQGELQAGDLVQLSNWKGMTSVQRLVEWLGAEDRNPSNGTMGYEVWAIEPFATRVTYKQRNDI
jgi:hypothetical protein